MGEAVRASDPRARVSLHVTTAKAPTGMPAHAVDPLLIEPGDYELSRDQVVRIEVSRGAHEEGTDDEVGHAIARKIVARHGGLMWTEATAEGVRTMLCFPVLLQKKAAGAERTAG
jgi:signal transduction histidine kinase